MDTPAGKRIAWAEPEVLLYDDDPFVRMSYPDLTEDGGKVFVTETQKTVARVHEVPPPLLAGLFAQHDSRTVAAGAVYASRDKPPAEMPAPPLPPLNRRHPTAEDQRGDDLRAGFSLEFWLDPGATGPLYDTRDPAGRGVFVAITDRGTVRLTLNDGRQEVAWESDRGSPRHVVLTVDAGPKLITVVRDGVLDDGGDERQFGWGRYSPTLRTPAGAATAKVGAAVRGLRVYGRPLRTSEAVGNFRAGSS